MARDFPVLFAGLGKLRNRQIITAAIVGMLPIVIAFVMMRHHWTSVPYYDDWYTPGGQIVSWLQGVISISDLWSQHNESRPFFPRLCYLALVWLSGRWDVKDEMLLMFGFACAASFALYLLLRRTTNLTPRGTLFAWALLNALLFCPGQYDEFLWGLEFVSWMPATVLLWATLVNVSGMRFQFKVIINAALAVIATYSFANGMLLWLLAVPIRWRTRPAVTRPQLKAVVPWYVLYGMAGAISIALYFFHYTRPPHSPIPILSYKRAGALGTFFLRWIGALFAENPADAFFLGLLLLAGFLFLGYLALKYAWLDRDWKAIYPWTVVGAYGLVSGFVIAVGRLGFGPNSAMASRYGPVTVFCYLAVAGLAVSIYSKISILKKTLSRPTIFCIGAAAGILAITWLTTFDRQLIVLKNIREERKRLALAVQWIAAIPDNPELKLAKIPAATIAKKARFLSEHGLLRPRLVAESLVNQVEQEPMSDDPAAGALQSVVLEERRKLLITGTARLTNQNKKPDCLVVGYIMEDHQSRPFAVFHPKFEQLERSEGLLVSDRSPDSFAVAVDADNLPKGAIALRAWSIDMAQQKAFPLAGSISIASLSR